MMRQDGTERFQDGCMVALIYPKEKLQDGPKMAPEVRDATKRPPEGFKRPQDGPDRLQDGPKRFQEGPRGLKTI